MMSRSRPRILIVIPARYQSTRFPGKPLALIRGKPMILHTLEKALLAKSDRVIVATDHPAIQDAVAATGSEAVMTDPDLPSGSDRVAAAAINDDAEIIVNVQGDEPLLDPSHIDLAVQSLIDDPRADISTLASPILSDEDLWNSNIVKVLVDRFKHAVYFSRMPVPFPVDSLKTDARKIAFYHRHIGLYVYRKKALQEFVALEPHPAEKLERLEQLRALMNGFCIHVEQVTMHSPGIDTPEDLKKMEILMSDIDEKPKTPHHAGGGFQ